MIKRCVLVLIVIIVSAALVYQPAAAKEDTAQITLKKTAVHHKKLYTYTVKQGDSLSNIIKHIPGITEKNISNNYQLIKELNPNISDLENLEPGQSLVIPGKPVTETEEKATTAVSSKISFTKGNLYKIKRGDTLFKIIRSQLKITENNIPKTLRIIKSINPEIRNVNKIYAGKTIKLPGKTIFVKTPLKKLPVAFGKDAFETLEKNWTSYRRKVKAKKGALKLPESIEDVISVLNQWLEENVSM